MKQAGEAVTDLGRIQEAELKRRDHSRGEKREEPVPTPKFLQEAGDAREYRRRASNMLSQSTYGIS